MTGGARKDRLAQIGGAIMLLLVIGLIWQNFTKADDIPEQFRHSDYYTPNQTRMIWAGDRAEIKKAIAQGKFDDADWWKRQCERDTGIVCWR
jgi:hypothetical protein